jgi:hypothetical protein
MAKSGRKCVWCGQLLQAYPGITINGAAYHDHCWDRPSEPVPQVRPSDSAHGHQRATRPGKMPAVEHLQLGGPPLEPEEAERSAEDGEAMVSQATVPMRAHNLFS